VAARHHLRTVVVLPDTVSLEEWRARDPGGRAAGVEWLQGSSGWVLRASELALVKSGTATLEAAILECPMVVAYRPGQFTSWAVKRLIRYNGPVSLANLYENGPFTRERVVPEVLHDEMTSERLEAELNRLIEDPLERDRMLTGLRRIREQALQGASGVPAAERVARGLIQLWGEHP
jgi:lipid-A-disaccharide synthase